MTNYEKLLTAKGYYCNMCDTYHAPDEMLHRYTLETLGEWCGQLATTKSHEVLCPNCNHTDEIEEFDPFMGSHLVAYQAATDTPMTFAYPLFDRATNGETYGYSTTTSVEELEQIADWYCIEVLDIESVEGNIVIRVDFQ